MGTLALLLVGAVGAPEWALGGWAVHLRLPAVFGALLFASAELRMKPPVRASLAIFALHHDRQQHHADGAKLAGL